MNSIGIFYIVATPIGNLDDITIRAVKTLLAVNGIACEDTRKAGFLLKTLRERYSDLVDSAVAIENQRLISYYEQNELQRIPEIVTALKNGFSIALISDAGTPAISDPGFKLIRECIREGIRIESIPGASSVISALVSSGLPTDKFLFVGYPPRKPGNRMKFFKGIKGSREGLKSTVIMFEAPHKLLKTLEEMQSIFGDIEIVIARELTKVHEEIRREKISDAIAHFQENDPRGEFIILFHPGVIQFLYVLQ